MTSRIEGQKIHLVFDIGEYNPKVIDFLTLLDITSKSKATDEDIEALKTVHRTPSHPRIIPFPHHPNQL